MFNIFRHRLAQLTGDGICYTEAVRSAAGRLFSYLTLTIWIIKQENPMDMDFKQLAVAIQAIAKKNLPKSTVKEVVEQALAAAYS